MRESDLIRMVWTGQSLIPDGNFAAAQLHDLLGEGQVVSVDLDPDRSGKSHRHQFAFCKTAWDNLPESMKGAPFAATSESLRKHALIKTGHCDVDMVAVGSEERAEKVAAMMSRMAVRMSGYAITSTKGNLVYCYTPHSQSMRAMGKDVFELSKRNIAEFLADLIGVTTEQLTDPKNAV